MADHPPHLPAPMDDLLDRADRAIWQAWLLRQEARAISDAAAERLRRAEMSEFARRAARFKRDE
jgi:hypothetical protein